MHAVSLGNSVIQPAFSSLVVAKDFFAGKRKALGERELDTIYLGTTGLVQDFPLRVGYVLLHGSYVLDGED